MARGNMFEVCTNINDIFCFEESSLYESLEALNVDYVKDIDREDANERIRYLLENLKKHGATVGSEETELDNGDMAVIQYVILDDDVRRRYFSARYAEMQKLALRISLDEFAKDTGLALYYLRMTIKDTMGDMVWFDGCYEELDTFIRTAPSDTKYYFGNVVLLH